MIRRILNLCLVEWVKYSRSPYPYAGIGIVAALTAASLFVRPVSRDGLSDFGFIAYAVPAALNLAGFLLSTVYSAGLIASEVDSGTIRSLLARPIQRHEFVCAKLLNGMAYAALLTTTAVVTTWLVALAFGELTGVAYGDELMYATNELYAALAIAAILNLPPYFAGVAYALFLSSIVRRPAAAITLAVGGWLLVDYVKHPLGIAHFVFTSYLDRSWIVLQDRCNALDTAFFPAAAYATAWSALWGAGFALAAVFVVGRRSYGP